MLNADQTSLLCPCNDLESQTILKIAKHLGLDIHQISGNWGLKLTHAFTQITDLKSLRQHVLIVEMPDDTTDESLVKQLQQLGKTVHIIDHHQYGAKPVTNALSSLEQFATYMGYELTEQEAQIAINDRDFLYGLSEAGVDWQTALELRQQEWALQGKTALMQEAQAFVDRNARDLQDLRLVLAPARFTSVMLEAAQLPDAKTYQEAADQHQAVKLKPVLVLYHKDTDAKAICQVEFAGTAQHKQALEELMSAAWLTRFKTWLGGGQHGCFFVAKSPHDLVNFDRLVSTLLELFLSFGRPLRHYGCTFFTPLDLFLESELAQGQNSLNLLKSFKSDDVVESHCLDVNAEVGKNNINAPIGQERQAYLYFLPHLRDSVFHTHNSKQTTITQAIKHWRLKEVAGFSLTLELDQDVGFETRILETRITDVSLYQYFNDLYVLGISVKPIAQLDESSLHRDGVTWWHDLVWENEQAPFKIIKQLQLHHWLHFTHQARLIYASFYEQAAEGKLPKLLLKTSKTELHFNDKFDAKTGERTPVLSRILVHLLQYFFKTTEQALTERLQFLPDDRMFVSVAYGLSGLTPTQQASRADLERLFSLALFVDRQEDTYEAAGGYAYDAEFMQALMKEQTLRRWATINSYSGYGSYANVYMGFGYFFNHVIAPSHVPFIYERMTLLGLLYQLTLRHYNRRISYATHALSEHKETKPFRELRAQFILFTNNYWFREVSSQTQGIEIFERQIQGLGLEKEYALIKDEMERADEFAHAQQAYLFNVHAVFLAVIALVITVFTVNAHPDYFKSLNAFKEQYGLIISATLVGGVIAWFGALWLKGKRWFKRWTSA